jgi:type IV pilus assembly protein PilW
MRAHDRSLGASKRQSGLTLVELLVALLIGLFLLGGLMTLVQDNKRTFNTQNQLAQLQDSERLGMTMMTDVIQTAGYFPDPTTNTPTTALPASGAWGATQPVSGILGTTSTGDTISVRYATNSGDGILSCNGTSNTSGAVYTYINTFYVVVNANGSSDLVCRRDDITTGNNVFPLVSGVTALKVLYGVNSANTGNNVDTYMTATEVNTALLWNNVISVQVTLTFTNPLYSAANPQGQLPTLNFQRNIGVMSVIGI